MAASFTAAGAAPLGEEQLARLREIGSKLKGGVTQLDPKEYEPLGTSIQTLLDEAVSIGEEVENLQKPAKTQNLQLFNRLDRPLKLAHNIAQLCDFLNKCDMVIEFEVQKPRPDPIVGICQGDVEVLNVWALLVKENTASLGFVQNIPVSLVERLHKFERMARNWADLVDIISAFHQGVFRAEPRESLIDRESLRDRHLLEVGRDSLLTTGRRARLAELGDFSQDASPVFQGFVRALREYAA